MLSITSGTVTVNAAFLQEIKEDHRLLHDYLERTRDALSRPLLPVEETAKLAELLARLRDQLAMHFTLEEAYGYFTEAVGVAPRLSNRAAELVAQHGPLYREIVAVAEAADVARHMNDEEFSTLKLSRRFRAFLTTFLEHEENENSLIIDAFDQDLGTGD
jgi:hypothetical protein